MRKAEEHLRWEREIQDKVFHWECGNVEIAIGKIREIPKRLMFIWD